MLRTSAREISVLLVVAEESRHWRNMKQCKSLGFLSALCLSLDAIYPMTKLGRAIQTPSGLCMHVRCSKIYNKIHHASCVKVDVWTDVCVAVSALQAHLHWLG